MTTSGSGDRQNRWQTTNHQLRAQLRASKHCTGRFALECSEELCIGTIPDIVDVLVKDFGLEEGNYVQTPATHDVTEEELGPLDQVQHSKCRSQVCKMFVPQPRSNRFYIHRDRVYDKVRQIPRNRPLPS